IVPSPRTSSRVCSSSPSTRASVRPRSSASSRLSKNWLGRTKATRTQREKGVGLVVWLAMDLHAFQAALHDGVEKERALRWAEAADLYATLARASSDSAMRALALLRQGNALMELRRWDDARTALDAALHEAKASGEPGLLGQALLRRAIHDKDRWREDLAEAVVFYDREGMTAKAGRLRGLLGKKVV